MSVLEYIDGEIFSPVYQNKFPEIKSDSIAEIAQELFYAIKGKEEIFIYGDYDMDGFCAHKVWEESLTSLYDIPPSHFNYVCRTHKLDSDILAQVTKTKARIVIICDTGSSREDREIIGLLRLRGYLPIVIDHHCWDGDYWVDKQGMLVFNSFEEKDVLDGYEVSGAYASLLVVNYLCQHYFNHALPYNAMVYALASMYSDVVDMATPVGRVLYNTISMIKMPGPALFIAMNKWNYSISKRFFSFIIAPKINACFRTGQFAPLNQALPILDRYTANSLVSSFEEVHTYASGIVDTMLPLFNRTRFSNICLCTHDTENGDSFEHIRDFSGLIATRISKEEKGIALVLLKMGSVYYGSYRDYYGRKLLNTFQLFCKADGHANAFGLSVRNLTEFKRHLQVLSLTLKPSTNRDYEVLSSSLLENKDDVRVLALYNEYMNVRPRVLLVHRCSIARLVKSTKYRKFYEVGLPYEVISTLPLIEGSTILVEPTISTSVELRCVE